MKGRLQAPDRWGQGVGDRRGLQAAWGSCTKMGTKREHTYCGGVEMPGSLQELRAAEAEVAQEWRWLHDALNEIARVRAEQGDAQAFRLMQAQAMAVGQRRIELSMRIAELERIGAAEPEVTASVTQNGALRCAGPPPPAVRGESR